MSKIKWRILKTSNQVFELEMMKGFLVNNGIDAVVMNKQDSSYQVFGECELLVKEKDICQASELLNQSDERDT